MQILGPLCPPLNNNKQEETEPPTSRNGETGIVIEQEIIPTKTNRSSQKKMITISQIGCCICMILYSIALLLSPGLFDRALTSGKQVICRDGFWDNNPNTTHCVGM